MWKHVKEQGRKSEIESRSHKVISKDQQHLQKGSREARRGERPERTDFTMAEYRVTTKTSRVPSLTAGLDEERKKRDPDNKDIEAERETAGEFRKRLTNYLRGGVVGAPTPGLEEVAISDCIPQPKVRNLYVAVLVEKNVLWLQVSVHDSPVVAVGNTWKHKANQISV